MCNWKRKSQLLSFCSVHLHSFNTSNHGGHEVMTLLTLSHLEPDWRSCEMSSSWVKEFRYCKGKESNTPAYTVLKMHQSQPGPLGMAVLKDMWNISKNTFLYITSLKWEVIFLICLGFMQKVPTMATSNRDVKIPLENMLVKKIMWSPLL